MAAQALVLGSVVTALKMMSLLFMLQGDSS